MLSKKKNIFEHIETQESFRHISHTHKNISSHVFSNRGVGYCPWQRSTLSGYSRLCVVMLQTSLCLMGISAISCVL